MTTPHAVTRRKAGRTAFDAQPIPRTTAQSARQERWLVLSDANVAALWLNAAKAAKALASYQRVVLIRQQLEDFRVRRTMLQPDPKAWETAYRELEEQRSLVKAGKKGRTVNFPGGRGYIDSPAYKKLYRQAERLHSRLNRVLLRYAFRPRVTYDVAVDIWRGGMVPDRKSRWFQMKIDRETTISEADAALSLVRLDLIGEIEKVRLCENCAERWFVAKKNFRFCSGGGCREASYAKDPKYLRRKANNQREYRKRLKLRKAEW